ncbi:MAG: hypothetical protein LDL31_01755 [Prosthecobacter sp.]|jgi:hypothetical protein|nr:hypothetical protein [Prosthecobacter sp.]
MKGRSLTLLAFYGFLASASANPEIYTAVASRFGSATANGILLLKGTAKTAEPAEWTVYAQDAFRPQEQLRISARLQASGWLAEPAGAGAKVLSPAPSRTLDFGRLRVRSAEARFTAAKAAALAQVTFVSIDYQLAANAVTGAPEWGMALLDETGHECGFVVVSGESGALIFQDWTPKIGANPPAPSEGSEGERAARAVKKAARKAWNWTDRARTETKGFFRELFR